LRSKSKRFLCKQYEYPDRGLADLKIKCLAYIVTGSPIRQHTIEYILQVLRYKNLYYPAPGGDIRIVFAKILQQVLYDISPGEALLLL